MRSTAPDVLRHDVGTALLCAIGRGLHGKFLGDAGDISADAELNPELASDILVTIRGVRAGDFIRDSHFVGFVDLIEMPEPLGNRINPNLVHEGPIDEEEGSGAGRPRSYPKFWSQEVAVLPCHKLSDGWSDVAWAMDSAEVKKALVPVLGSTLVIIDGDWKARDFEIIDLWIMGDDVRADLVPFGQGMDSAD